MRLNRWRTGRVLSETTEKNRHMMSVLRSRHALWCIVNSSQLAQTFILQITFHNLVTKQCQHATAHEYRSRVAIPIDARSAASIIYGLFGFRAEFPQLFKVQRSIAQENDRG